jgi:signal transduction histidine kinase
VKQRESVGLWLALGILGVVAVVAYRSVDATTETVGWVEHTQQVLGQLAELSESYARTTSARRAYVVAGDASQIADVASLDARVARTVATLRALCADNEGQIRQLDLLERLIEQRVAGLDTAAQHRRLVGTGTETAEGLAQGARVRTVREEMAREEIRLLAERNAITRRDLTHTKRWGVIATVASFAILLFVFGRLEQEVGRRARSEQALQHANHFLDAANRELEAFSYAVAHDLRAPLRAIDGFSQALLEDCAGKLDADGTGHLERVRSGVAQMGRLIDGLLVLSRVTREIVREKVDLSELATDSGARLREAHPGRDVELVVHDGLVVLGDARLLAAALDNLLGNAWKFTGKCAHARIEVGEKREDGVRVFFVRDNGAGFDPAYADKLFRAFQRLHSVTEFEGTGIGLATVQRIVQRHGGWIRAEGEVGRGATFYFTL